MTAPLLPRVAASLLAIAFGGCLITEPVLPIDGEDNLPPVFMFRSPDPNATVTIQLNSTPIEFNARASDDLTQREQLFYIWQLDGTTKQREFDQTSYTTTGQEIGAGEHVLSVTVEDEQGAFETLQWNVLVQ